MMELLSIYSRSVLIKGKVYYIGQKVVFTMIDTPYGVDWIDGTIEKIMPDGIWVVNGSDHALLRYEKIDVFTGA